MKKVLQWHPAFQAVLQIEFSGEAQYLQFFKEYNLTDSPLRIDTLVIKKDQGVEIQKKIGRIFRWYNIVEYKGPEDSLSVNTFFKANGYAAILQSGTKREQEIPPDEITITLVGNHYPRKLMEFLKSRYPVRITNMDSGIYYVEGLLFPLQILVQKELDSQENLWLSRLRQDLNREQDVEVLSRAYMGKEDNPLYSAAMDLIVRANWNVYKEENQMCDALKELFDELYGEKIEKQIQIEKNNARAEGKAEGKAEGRAEGKAEGKVEGKAEGKTEGQALSVLDLLEDIGPVPSSLRKTIMAQKDGETLSRWLKAAAKANSLEQFQQEMTVPLDC